MRAWSLVQAIVVLWLLRKLLRLTRTVLAAVVLAACWPVTLVALLGWLAAWLRGWPPARLYRAAAWSLPMTSVYMIVAAHQAGRWQGIAAAPARDWAQAARLLSYADVLPAILLTVPWAVPAGLAAGGAAWARHCWAISTGLAGRTAFAAAAFDIRQWHRQAAAARGALASPGTLPLVTSAGMVPVGPVIRTVGTRWKPVHAVPAALFARHMVIIGSSGRARRT